MARSNAEWSGTDMEISLEGYKKKVRACAKCIWGAKVEKRSEFMGYVHLPSLCCPALKKIDIAIVRLGTQGRADHVKI